MILWINGTFGVGKTQTAHELQRRLAGSVISDPEHLGFALHRMTPPKLRGDFQDDPLWREGTRRFLSSLVARWPGPVIVPMTLVVPDYFDEIVGGLRREGVDIQHFTLLAPNDVILHRLRKRGEGATSFGARQVEQCLSALEQPLFSRHLDTDQLSIEEVAERIAAGADLALSPRSGNTFTAAVRRFRVQWAHRRTD